VFIAASYSYPSVIFEAWLKPAVVV